MKYLGIDYYPEHWGLEMLEEDLNNIIELGANLIRVGDFAWDVFEKEDGKYDFSFFDQVIKKVKEKNLKIMMGVPGATIPSWLYHKHPEIMNVDAYGYRQPFGARRGHCYNNDIYLKKVNNLAKAIAKHYKNENAIVAYQVENEIGHEGSDNCFCETCHKKFITYLKNKYKKIEILNERWGTIFWTQTYYDFNDIPMPLPSFTPHNPSLRLEWERFKSQSAVNLISSMTKSIKMFDKNKPVTHDFEGGTILKHFNPFDIAKEIDFVSYNNYPVWGGQKEPLSESDLAFSLDFVRGFKNKKYWITETIMGQQGHNDIGYAPRPNEAKKWALMSLNHGVESLIFFRYRGFTKGAEQFCAGILDADNQKRRKYYETQSFFNEAKNKKITYPKSNICLIYDYDSKSSMNIQRQSDDFNYEKEFQKFYKQLYQRNLSCDIQNSDQSFSKYKLVIIPYMIIMDDEFKERLKKYVKKGGIVILTARSAWKDKDNNLIFNKRLPVDLDDLCGAVIEEHETKLGGQYSNCIYKKTNGKAYIFNEYLKTINAKELIKYEHSSFGNYAAATKNNYGKGKCYYLGASFEDKILNKLFDEILKDIK